jgi:hypothetical protein
MSSIGIRRQALHRKAFAYDIDPPSLPGGRPIQKDATLLDYRRLDALSRQRALSNTESRRLEECIRHLDRRAEWRDQKRKQREARA